MIKILGEEDEEALDKHIKEEILPKIEPDIGDEQYVCRPTRTRKAPLQYNPSTGKDYKLRTITIQPVQHI